MKSAFQIFRRVVATVVVVWFVSIVVFMIFGGDLYFLNPKFRKANLMGLTSEQVVQRLGTPSDDPRVPRNRNSPASTRPIWKDEQTDGHLYLAYEYHNSACVIEFSDDKVVDVERVNK